ncbi:MAG TPA: hypothetical protein VGN72_01440 [Tepidisphaeraceae bacterium]|nr:hypothetical protein [Tepidisphaeraceae bacterium]
MKLRDEFTPEQVKWAIGFWSLGSEGASYTDSASIAGAAGLNMDASRAAEEQFVLTALAERDKIGRVILTSEGRELAKALARESR